MNVLGLNLDIIWKDKKANYSTIEAAFKNERADLYVLPEMFATGFCMDAAEIADQQEETLTWMKAFAKDKNAAICGSVSVEEKNQFFNRFYFVNPDGTHHQYDKRHLFTYSGEDKIYTPGKERVILQYGGFRMLLQVCYDLRFPVFSRNKEDYDLVLYVANWPEKRVMAWEHLLKARAIENQAYVFGINRIGKDGNDLNYPESSHCFFADGTSISEKSGNLVRSTLDKEKLELYRLQFPFLKDADAFHLE